MGAGVGRAAPPRPSARGAATSLGMLLRDPDERDGSSYYKSRGMGVPSREEGKRVFDTLVEYPCEFELKVIGYNSEEFEQVRPKLAGLLQQLISVANTYTCVSLLSVASLFFMQDISRAVAEVCDVPVDELSVSHRLTASQKWRSLTIMCPVQSAAMLYEVYEVVDRDDRVRFKF